MTLKQLKDLELAVIGLGYVGLPLAVAFGKSRAVSGFDVNADRIAQLRAGQDATHEVSTEELSEASGLHFCDAQKDIAACNTYIVTVPTPVDFNNRPNLSPLLNATKTVAQVLKPGDLVIYESTVFPGATEEVCVPVLEQISGLTLNAEFYVGYSPERINPGDKTHRLPDICKVTSGSTPEAAALVDALYASIVTAGTYKAQSIRVAEAAKVIENTQRDVNIALINELAMLFNKMDIDTDAVLKAAGTKWNFLPFRPGLVGGHCIGVDPYYLTHKAQEIGHHPEIILAGRRINDGMADYVASQTVKSMLHKEIPLSGARVLIMGVTFKENCPDVRNTKVIDVVQALRDYGIDVDITDPQADSDDVHRVYGLTLTAAPEKGIYDAIILAVPHTSYTSLAPQDIRKFGKNTHIFFDLKSIFPHHASDLRL